MKSFSVKPKIYFENGAIEYLNTLKGERAFIITDPFMVKIGFADRIIKILKSKEIKYEVFSEVEPDPPIDVIAKGVKKMENFKPDVVIALGGGSSIDAAKSILMFTTGLLKIEKGDYDKPLFIAIPTTSGTGSEVTGFSVITNKNKKFPLFHEELIPDVAIIDADFVKTVPPRITADTAIDALTHAVEAYVSNRASDYSDALAEKAVKLIFKYILRAYKDGNDLEAREKLHNAACIAGMAFTNASVGINHSMAHTIGGNFHIPHGRANAILFPYVIKYNADIESGRETEAAKRYAQLAKILDLPSANIEEGVKSFLCGVKVILKETDTPMSLREAKVDREALDRYIDKMADSAILDICTETNPRIPTKQEIIRLFYEAF